jgi:MFS family permease
VTSPPTEGDPPRLPARRAGLRRIVVDPAPLRLDHDYRWLWAGQVVSGMGTQITRIALPYQVYVLTGSTLAIAGLTLFQLVPTLLFALGAGSLADTVDRRKLLWVTQSGQAVGTAALVVLALQGNPPIIALFVVAFVLASFAAVDQPARGSAIPRLVPPERLASAISLNQLNVQTATVVGPAIGGVLLATVGVAGAYFVDVLSFGAALLALAMMSPIPPLVAGSRPGLEAIREGLRFALQRRVILASFVIDLNAMIFGRQTALLPVLALDVFHVGEVGIGLMAAAPALGASIAALLSGWIQRIDRLGRAVVIAVTVYGLATLAFGLSAPAFLLALAFLAVQGAADIQSAVCRNLIIQFATPDELRGRVTSIHFLVVSGGPRIGDIEAAAMATLIGAQGAVIVGALLCLAGTGAIARGLPELVRHRVVRESLPRQSVETPASA